MRCLVLSLVILAAAPLRAELAGKIVGPDNVPVAAATVLIYSAAPAEGPGTSDRYEYPECAKSTKSDANGAFRFGIDPSLRYEIFVAAEGYRPTMSSGVDPQAPYVARLQQIPAELDPACTFRGRVVDATGAPIAAARIRQTGWSKPGMHAYQTSSDVDRQTWSDDNGEFLLIGKKPGIKVDVEITARQAAQTKQLDLSPGNDPTTITLKPGVAVTGRLLRDQEPVAGAAVKICVNQHRPEQFEGDLQTVTDTEGRFRFKHVAVENYNLYVPLGTLDPPGAVPITACGVASESDNVDVGDIAVEKGFSVCGQVVCSDGAAPPADITLRLERSRTLDATDVGIDRNGKFEFTAIPGTQYELTLKSRSYHLSPENQSYMLMSGFCCLLGLIDQDIVDLKLTLDPGPLAPSEKIDWTRLDMLGKKRLAGAPNGN